MKIDYSEIGNRIRSKRKQAGMTQAALAEAPVLSRLIYLILNALRQS